MEWAISMASVAVTALIGYGTYRVTEKRRADTKSGDLFEDARSLKDDYKQAYNELKAEVRELRITVDELREELHEQSRWREVAVTGAHAEVARTGTFPLWWPSDETLPPEVA